MVEQGSCGVWLCMGRAGRQGLGRLGRGREGMAGGLENIKIVY